MFVSESGTPFASSVRFFQPRADNGTQFRPYSNPCLSTRVAALACLAHGHHVSQPGNWALSQGRAVLRGRAHAATWIRSQGRARRRIIWRDRRREVP
jgi:hypothetical protein